MKGKSMYEKKMDVEVKMVLLKNYLKKCIKYIIGKEMVKIIMWHLDDEVEI
jgi:hypothetical protein